MKQLGITLCLLFATALVMAQETYNIEGESLQLKIEVDGELDLLWNIIDGHYRYFLRESDGTITELVNTRDVNRDYQEEYKTTLEYLTDVSAAKVNLTLVGLKEFLDAYNLTQDPNYVAIDHTAKLQLLLGVFGGITNSPLINNPNNALSAQFGAEVELLDVNRIKRHALFMQLRHVFEANDFEYSTTELALGYRFRFINTSSFGLYGHTKFATLNFLRNTVPGPDDEPIDLEETIFDVPFTFGLGADIKLTDNSFFTIGYHELFAVLLENNGHFSTNITLGYKFNL